MIQTHLSRPSSKVFVAGHKGLVGSAILQTLKDRGYKNIITRTREELNLLNGPEVDKFFAQEQPEIVFLAAAKVGGILANNTYKVDFLYENLQIQNHVISSAHKFNCKRLVFLGSSCVYPRLAPQPMTETDLLTSSLELTNRPYALAKIAGLEYINCLRAQYGRDYFSVMPTNLFGPGDNFHPENSHVLPALIRRICEAKDNGSPHVTIWGSGKPLREFMFSKDCAEAIVFLAENLSSQALTDSVIGKDEWSHINIGTGEEISIRDLATLIAEIVDYKGSLEFDTSKPDGTMRKLMNSTFLRDCGWKAKQNFATHLKETIQWYREHSTSLRK